MVKDNNRLKNKVYILASENEEVRFTKELYSFFGNNKNYDYILKTTFVEQKENRVVKQNQVAEKIDYTFEVEYELFYKTKNCLVFKKEIISRFSFTPKSFGYNFGADRSFEKLYTNTSRQNIQKFIDLAPLNTTCL
ncbi:hypothetical protein OAJ53_02355 [Pelagibacteraceae bacterium]|nr:hypothetical protein [Pelagibacteraceae bacterium]